MNRIAHEWFCLIGAVLFFTVNSHALEQVIKHKKITVEDGLSSNMALGIHQGFDGFLWFGTVDGLNRYDGNQIISLHSDPQDKSTLSSNNINSFVQKNPDIIWIGTWGGGLNKLDQSTGEFTRYCYSETDTACLSNERIQGMSLAKDGTIWIATRKGLNHFDPDTGKFERYLNDPGRSDSLSHNIIYGVAEAKNGHIWVATENGLSVLNPELGKFRSFFPVPDNQNSLSHQKILSVLPDPDDPNIIWIGTSIGLERYDIQHDQFRHFKLNRNSEVVPSVERMMVGKNGPLWLGTNSGRLIEFSRNSLFFKSYLLEEKYHDNPLNLPIWGLTQSHSGKIWVALFSSGIISFYPKSRQFTKIGPKVEPDAAWQAEHSVNVITDDRIEIWNRYKGIFEWDIKTEQYYYYPYPKEVKGLRKYYDGRIRIKATRPDRNGNKWFSFGKTLFKLDRNQSRLVKKLDRITQCQAVDDPEIYLFQMDKNDGIWVGDGISCLSRIDLKTLSITSYYDEKNRQGSEYAHKILLDESRNVFWSSSHTQGLLKINYKTKAITTFKHIASKANSLPDNYVTDLYLDQDQTLWITTWNNGFARYNEGDDTFTSYRVTDGLINNSVLGIIQDDQDNFWISTIGGLSKFNPVNQTFENYLSEVKEDFFLRAFPGEGLNYQNGKIYITGEGGLLQFNPEEIKPNPVAFPLQITSFKVLGKETVPKGGRLRGNKIHLGWEQNFISFEFSLLDFDHLKNKEYQYQLAGIDDTWVDSGNRQYTSYSNLPGGKYTLQIRGRNKGDQWNSKQIELPITIAIAPWKTWWAYSIYIISLSFILGLISRSRSRAQQRKIMQQELVVTQLKRLDKYKDTFLANTSHELRTPLNGIVGLTESLLETPDPLSSEKNNRILQGIIQSGKRLSFLVDDILDYSKMKNQDLTLALKPVSLKLIADSVIALNEITIKNKPVQLLNHIAKETPLVEADENRLLQIFYNLIGNALKFTHEGSIDIRSTTKEAQVWIEIEDTGIGIDEQDLAGIFLPFEQSPLIQHREYKGTGLGLPITRQLVELHGGTIQAESQLAKGSIFRFSLPISHSQQATKSEEEPITKISDPDPVSTDIEKKTPYGETILVVDDEPINLEVVENHLVAEGYHVLLASNGARALELLDQNHIDLVILDIMMPEINGYEVCKVIREKFDIGRLPVIMLTAKTSQDAFAESFQAGANDFLTKPFYRQELLTRVRSHIQVKSMVDLYHEKESLKAEVTLRKQRELELKKTQFHLAKLLDAIDDAVLTITASNKIIFFNQGAEQLFGYASDEIVGQSVESLFANETDYTRTIFNFDNSSPASPDHQQSHAIDFRTKKGATLNGVMELNSFSLDGETLWAAICRPEQKGSSDHADKRDLANGKVQNKDRQIVSSLNDIVGMFKEYGEQLTTEMNKLDHHFEEAGPQPPSPSPDPFRAQLVKVLNHSLQTWESATGKSKIELAEESDLWKVHLDKSSYYTRTLDKYLEMESLPQRPRWRDVVKTAEFVLEHTTGSQHQELAESLGHLKTMKNV